MKLRSLFQCFAVELKDKEIQMKALRDLGGLALSYGCRTSSEAFAVDVADHDTTAKSLHGGE